MELCLQILQTGSMARNRLVGELCPKTAVDVRCHFLFFAFFVITVINPEWNKRFVNISCRTLDKNTSL